MAPAAGGGLPCFVSWSGGKDCCLALWRARRAGLDVKYLLTTYSRSTGHTMGHGFPLGLVRLQAESLGAELVAVKTEWREYEADFKAALGALDERGVMAGVYGDVDLAAHREWVERVTRDAGLTAHLPLWGEDQRALLREFVAAGFEAIIVAARADLGLSWLGRALDERCAGELERALGERDLSPSGEGGEYHTLVIGGPGFSRRLEVQEAVPVLRRHDWVLGIRRFGLEG